MRGFSVFKVYSNELKRDMEISVSLPENHDTSLKRYPVLYMTDGQNLFDDSLAAYGKSWGILTAYENEKQLPNLIIVGISSNEERSNELVPYQFSFDGETKKWGGKANLFLEFITNNLIPYIDTHYKSIPSSEQRGMMGSSFGGLFSTYAALEYSTYFTRFGCVSNAYYPTLNQLIKDLEKSDLSKIKKFYMDVGTKESSDQLENKLYLETNRQVYEILQKKLTDKQLKFLIIEGAIHHESAWELRFPAIIKYLFEQ